MRTCSIVCVTCMGSARRVGRGLPGDGARAPVTSRRLYSRPARAPGRAAASGVPRDYRRLLQDAGDSGSRRPRLRPDRHRGGRGSPSSTRPWHAPLFQESPIGHRIQTGTNRKVAWMEIVGVVGDTRWQDPSQPRPGGDLRRINAGRRQLAVHPGSNLIGQPVARRHASHAPCTTRTSPCRSSSRRWTSCSTPRWRIPGFARR